MRWRQSTMKRGMLEIVMLMGAVALVWVLIESVTK